ncbi:hypothetical protein [Fodinibius saliphilus]|uniref:hypothetical protein n=1 Tax=Fodinibius saliphilus TaxID=1920650 RepID=UPI001109208C|nr:hypothetical protein [Fodinibius saliphilus]
MDTTIKYLPLEWIESEIGKSLPIKAGNGLSKTDPLILSGMDKSEVPELEHAIIRLSLKRYGLQPATGITQELVSVNGRWIEKVELKFSFSGRNTKNAKLLRVYFDLTEIIP